MICNICPRACKVERNTQIGFCGVGKDLIINKVMLHKFEEPTISVGAGSGAIFFAGCILKCVFCQNYKISHSARGRVVSPQGLVEIFKKLEKRGASNINLVTPTHFSLGIIKALKIYKPKIPVVWNSSGYESVRTINKLKGLVDVFLVDYKYSSNKLAMKYSLAPNYVQHAQKAILAMKKLAPHDIVENGVMKAGLIVRHLVLPNNTSDSVKCLKFVCEKLGADSIVSIMSQYTPTYKAKQLPEINRRITPLEYKRVVNFAINAGMKNCFVQSLTSASTKYTPRFK